MLRRVEDQRRVKDGEPERRKDLDKKEHRGALRGRGEPVFDRLHRPSFLPAKPAGQCQPAGSARAVACHFGARRNTSSVAGSVTVEIHIRNHTTSGFLHCWALRPYLPPGINSYVWWISTAQEIEDA